MKLTRWRNRAPWIILLGWAALPGCIHNHYYGVVPAGAPIVPGVTTQVGSVCDIPPSQTIVSSGSLSSGVVTTIPAGTPLVMNPPNPQRIIISQPAYGPSLSQSMGRFNRWRRPDPEGVATIRTEGGLTDDTTIQR